MQRLPQFFTSINLHSASRSFATPIVIITMKFQITINLLAAASAHAIALGNTGRAVANSDITIDTSVMNSAAYDPFLNTKIVTPDSVTAKRDDVVTPDYIFVLQCVDAGFREPCLVFGAPPGKCGR